MKILILTEHTHNRIGGIETYTRLLMDYFHSQNHKIDEYSLNLQINDEIEPKKTFVTQLNSNQGHKLKIFKNKRKIEELANGYDLVINQINNFPWSKKTYQSKKWIFIQHFSPSFYQQHFIMGKFFAKTIYFLMWLFNFKNPFKNFQNSVVFTEEDAYKLGVKNNFFIIPLAKYKISEIDQFKKMKTLNNGKFIYFGRINNKQKRVSLIQKNFSENMINFYGKDDLNLIKETSLIKFKGLLKNNEIPNTLLKYKWMVLLSKYEGFPFTIVESLSCGLPLITSNCFEGAEFLTQNHSLLTNNKSKDLIEKIAIMNNLSNSEYEKMSNDCFEFAKKYLSLEKFNENWENVLKNSINRIID